MKLTPLQLEIQQRSDKTLKLWTIVKIRHIPDYVQLTEIFDISCDDIPSYKIGDKLPHGEQLFVRYAIYSGDVSLDHIAEVVWCPIDLWYIWWVWRSECKEWEHIGEDSYKRKINQSFHEIDEYVQENPIISMLNVMQRPVRFQKMVRDFFLLVPTAE